jgi:hypothetical protein
MNSTKSLWSDRDFLPQILWREKINLHEFSEYENLFKLKHPDGIRMNLTSGTRRRNKGKRSGSLRIPANATPARHPEKFWRAAGTSRRSCG